MEDRGAVRKNGGVFAWCLYDWANSAFPTVIITFVFATYVTNRVAPDVATGTAWWGWAMSISGLMIALLSPALGAIADQSGRRKPWILTFSALCVLLGTALWLVQPQTHWLVPALLLVGAANIAFEVGTVFYNAMLPEIAPRARLGRVSGWAWALGYAGGLVCLALCLLLLVDRQPPLFGLDPDRYEPVRATGPFVALWFAVFALPMFLLTPDRPDSGLSAGEALRRGLATLRTSLGRLSRHPAVPRFLLARLLYTDGLNTLFAFGGIYAAGTFGLDFREILVFGILLNISAGIGAFAFAWVDDWIGAKRTILLSVGALMALGLPILLIESQTWFYILGCGIGLFIGPAQSASRSMMARLAPPELRAEMFGLYALSGRITAWLGPLLVGTLTWATGSQRWGMASILLLLALGWLVLLPLRDTK